MSLVISKAFDAAKGIVRTIFKGSPNLFTTSDLNRQIEALKYQLDQLDEKVGFQSDMEIRCSGWGSTGITVIPTFTYLTCRGIEFNGLVNHAPLYKPDFAQEAYTDLYLCVRGNYRLVTYTDDDSHEIAGAKFEDGTSRAAANQLVVDNAALTLTYNPQTELEDNNYDFLFVVAKIFKNSDGAFIVKPNYISRMNESVLLQSTTSIKDLSIGAKDDVLASGMSYDRAFKVLDERWAPRLRWVSIGGMNYASLGNVLYLEFSSSSCGFGALSIDGVTLCGSSFKFTADAKWANWCFRHLSYANGNAESFSAFIHICPVGQGGWNNMRVYNDPLDLGLYIEKRSEWTVTLGVKVRSRYVFGRAPEGVYKHMEVSDFTSVPITIDLPRGVIAIPVGS